DGRADMDESMITGESRPVTRGEGDAVTAGTVATDSGLRVGITATGDDTALAGINRLVAEAQGSSSRAQRIADKAAALLFWFALGRHQRPLAAGGASCPALRREPYAGAPFALLVRPRAPPHRFPPPPLPRAPPPAGHPPPRHALPRPPPRSLP